MARYEGKFTADGPATIDLPMLFATLSASARVANGELRKDAIVRLLSGAGDWRDASLQLGGCFAEQGDRERLRGAKEE